MLDYNKNIKNNMLNNFKIKNGNKCDILFKDLNQFKDIKGWIQYLHKNKVWVFCPKIIILEKYSYILETIFSDSYTLNYKIKNNSDIPKNFN